MAADRCARAWWANGRGAELYPRRGWEVEAWEALPGVPPRVTYLSKTVALVCCHAQIGAIDENWRSQKCLHQIPRLVDRWCAVLSRICVFENVDHWRRLLLLEKVNDPNEVVEKGKYRIHGSQMPTTAADALTLPNAAR